MKWGKMASLIGCYQVMNFAVYCDKTCDVPESNIDYTYFENSPKVNFNDKVSLGGKVNFNDKMGSSDQMSSRDKKKMSIHYNVAGYRANDPMEDRFSAMVREQDASMAVFDGHGGWQVAEYVKDNLIVNVLKELDVLKVKTQENEALDSAESKQTGDKKCVVDERTETCDEMSLAMEKAIIRGFERTDRDLLAVVRHSFQVGFGTVARIGSCALFVHVKDGVLYVANGWWFM